ncbi:hypothetical protein BGX24_009786 [Mortierella sp. AD032]|nr:hypothetical protein BGX24_009786 [Mortierella sp. AD032]
MVPAAQSQSNSTLVLESNRGRILTSTVVTRPARPDEIQALYAAILGRQKVSTEEREHQSSFQSKGLIIRQDTKTGGSQSRLCRSDDLEFEEEAEPKSDSTLVPEDDKGRMLEPTVVTRLARPDEIQALYAGILGRRKVSTQEQEYQSTYLSEGLITIQDSDSGDCGSKGPELKENVGVLKEQDEEVTLTAEILLQKKLEELGPCHPGTKRRRPSTDKCEMEFQAEDIDDNGMNGETLQHKCQVFDGLCWSQGTRELTLGIYWFHKGERSLRSVHRRFDKFQVMSSPDYDDDVRTRHHLKLAKASTRRP